MPRAVFKLLWGRLAEGKEAFGYVVNLAANGDHYWVFAHMTPSYGMAGEHVGYHSSRRTAVRKALDKVIPLYKELRAIEDSATNRAEGLEASFKRLEDTFATKGMNRAYPVNAHTYNR
jgi:hypothetical protein